MVGDSAHDVGHSPTGALGRAAPLDWHQTRADAVAQHLGTTLDGLPAHEAANRLSTVGPNSLAPPQPVHWARVLWDQVRSLIVMLLVAVFLVALLLQDFLEAAAVGAVLAINISIGFITELRARRAMEALTRMQIHSAIVVRDGNRLQVDAREVVPGDVIVLTEGEAVPADARIAEATELEVNEAPLTGESLPVPKNADSTVSADSGSVPLADRSSMVYKGTMVASGNGLAYTVGTGRNTEIGRVSELIASVEEGPTPLETQLARLGRRLIWATLSIAATITVMGIARGRETWLMVETGIALAIAAIPEGLPVVATIALAVGLQRMARRQALVRRLPAVEGLGSVTLVCADKTGTLTTGQMTVTRIEVGESDVALLGAGMEVQGDFHVHDQPRSPEDIPGLLDVLRSAVLANRASVEQGQDGVQATGDPTEVALLVAGMKAGLTKDELLNDLPESHSVPFSSDRMLMATFHTERDGSQCAFVKGAPDRLIDLSTMLLTDDGDQALDEDARESLRDRNRALSGNGLRVLAMARRTLPLDEQPSETSLQSLTFLGLVGISDPPADKVRDTLTMLREAGVATVMITGDQARTAEAVASEIGLLEGGQVVSSPDFDSDVAPIFDQDVRVFARVTPSDKLHIVEGFQQRGEIVAMLGDGINDAPAIKQADIGVAMGGRGTDVAKETADLVLQDDRFETIAAAVREGRVIYENIRKFVFYLFSCNLSEVGLLSLAAFTNLPSPLLPLQILWLNLITDVFPALALAMEPAEADVMARPPRNPTEAFMSKAFTQRTLAYGALLTASCGAAFLIALFWLDVSASVATTVAFQTLALSQLAHVFNARTRGPLRMGQILGNRWILGAVALTVALQFAAVTHPVLIEVLSTVHVTEVPWGLVAVFSLLPLLIGQLWKRIAPPRTERGGTPIRA